MTKSVWEGFLGTGGHGVSWVWVASVAHSGICGSRAGNQQVRLAPLSLLEIFLNGTSALPPGALDGQ